MIARAGSGWQTILADLSLILFMVAVSALPSSGPQKPRAAPDAVSPSELGEPLAIWREAPGMPPLGQWLAEQSPDRRQQLTVLAQYRPGGQAEARARALELASQSGGAGTAARIIVEPGDGGIAAELAFDVPQAAVAQQLLDDGTNPVQAKEAP